MATDVKPDAAQATNATAADGKAAPATADVAAQEAPKAAAADAVVQTQEQPKEAAKQTDAPKKEGEEKASAAEAIAIAIPEGVKVNGGLMNAYVAAAKEVGLNKQSAQKIADTFIAAQKAADAEANAVEKATREKWDSQLRDDKEFGGAHLDATRAAAKKAIERFGGKELSDAVSALGLDNHPALVKAFARAGQKISEDRIAGMTAQADDGLSARERQLRARYPSNFAK